MKTAVEYIKEKLQGYGFDFGYVLDVAKEMEKEQIEMAFFKGKTFGMNLPDGLTAEQYYKETFKSE